MLRWLRSLFAWEMARHNGVWTYWVNTVTGRRAAERVSPNYQPLDIHWLCADEPHSGEPKINGIPISRSKYRFLYMNYYQDAEYREALSSLTPSPKRPSA